MYLKHYNKPHVTGKGKEKYKVKVFYLLAGRRDEMTPHRDFRLQSDEANSNKYMYTYVQGDIIRLRVYNRDT